MNKISKLITVCFVIFCGLFIFSGSVYAARTESSWLVSQDGTYIYPSNPLNVLIASPNKYLNFGTFSGSSGYGFRDNGGIMEFKNNSGSWTAVGSGGGGGSNTAAFFTATSTTATSTLPILNVSQALNLSYLNSNYKGECLRINTDKVVASTTCAIGVNLERIYGQLIYGDTSAVWLGDSTSIVGNNFRWGASLREWPLPWVGITTTELVPGIDGMFYQQGSYTIASSTKPGDTFATGGTNDTITDFVQFSQNTGIGFNTYFQNLSKYVLGDWTKGDRIKANIIFHKPGALGQTNGGTVTFTKSNGTTQFISGVDYAQTNTYGTSSATFTNIDNHNVENIQLSVGQSFTSPNCSNQTCTQHTGGIEFHLVDASGVSKPGFSVITIAKGGHTDEAFIHNGGSNSVPLWDNGTVLTQTQIRNTFGLLDRKPNTIIYVLGTNCGTNECQDTDASQQAFKTHVAQGIDDWNSDVVATQIAAGNTGYTTASTTVFVINNWTYGSANAGAEADYWGRRRGQAERDLCAERGWSCLDMYQLLLATYGQNFHNILFQDGVHQNLFGQVAIGRASWAAISGQIQYQYPTLTINNGTFSTDYPLGLGTTTCASWLCVSATSTGEFRDPIVYFSSSTSPFFSLRSTGKLGLGVFAPAAQLHVLGTTEQFRLAYDASNYWSSTIGSTGGLSMQGVGSAGALTVTPTAGQSINLNMSTTGDLKVNTNQLYVDTSAARVGINTATPATDLEVNGTASSTLIKTTNVAYPVGNQTLISHTTSALGVNGGDDSIKCGSDGGLGGASVSGGKCTISTGNTYAGVGSGVSYPDFNIKLGYNTFGGNPNQYIGALRVFGLANQATELFTVNGEGGFSSTTSMFISSLSSNATTTVGADLSGKLVTIPTPAGYILQFNSTSQSPADGAGWCIGLQNNSPSVTCTTVRVYVPKTGTIKSAYCFATLTGGSSETSTSSVEINNTTDNVISAAVDFSGSTAIFSNTSMSAVVSQGDYLGIKFNSPTWVTNPTVIRPNCVVYIE